MVLLDRPTDPDAAIAWNALIDVVLPVSQAVGVRTGRLVFGTLLETNDGTCTAVWDSSQLSFRPVHGWYSRGMVYVQHAGEARMGTAPLRPTAAQAASALGALREGVLSGAVSYGGVPGDVGAPGSGVVVVSVGPARSGDMLDGAAALAWARSASTPAVVVRQPVESMQLDACSEQALGPAGRGTDAAAAFFRSVWADEASQGGRGGEAVGGTMGLACTHQLGQPLYPLRSVPHIVVHTLPALPPHPVPTAHGTTCPTTGLRWGMTKANIAAIVASGDHPGWESAADVPAWALDRPPRWRQAEHHRALSARRGASGPWQVIACAIGQEPHLATADRTSSFEASDLERGAASLGVPAARMHEAPEVHAALVGGTAAALLSDTAARARECADAGTWDPAERLPGRLHQRLSSSLAVFTPAVVTLRSALTAVPWYTAASRATPRGNKGAPAPGDPVGGRGSVFNLLGEEMDSASRRSALAAALLASFPLAPSHSAGPALAPFRRSAEAPSLQYASAWADAPRAVAPASPDEPVVSRVLCVDVDGFRDANNTSERSRLCNAALAALPAGRDFALVPASGLSPEVLHDVAGSHAGGVPSLAIVTAAADVGIAVLLPPVMRHRLAATRLIHAAGVPAVAIARISHVGIVNWDFLNESWHPEAAAEEPEDLSTAGLVAPAMERGEAALLRDGGVTTDVNATITGLHGWGFEAISTGAELRAPPTATASQAWRRLRALRARDDAVARRERLARRFRPVADDSAWQRLRGLRTLAQAATLASAAQGYRRDAASAGRGRGMRDPAQSPSLVRPSTPLDAAEPFPTPYRENPRGRLDVVSESLLVSAAAAVAEARRAQRTGPLESPMLVRYLEIGCQGDATFTIMQAQTRAALVRRLGFPSADAAMVEVQRFGVDPVRGGNLRMTSDAFFADPRFRSLRFHTVFVDGLHEAQQVLRDVENSLARLEEGGAIVMHDIGAPNRRMEMWPADPDDATDSALSGDGGHRMPWRMGSGGWNGDTWRAMASLLTRHDVVAAMVESDNGVGLVRRARNPSPAVLPAPALPRSRTLGDDGMLDAVVGESASDRRSLEASGRRQIHAWSEDPAMAPGAAEALVGRPDATGQTPCDDDNDRLFTLLSLRHTAGTPTDAEVEQAVSEGEASMGRLFSSGRPLLTHPAVRCLRAQLGESRDDLRLKDAIDELAGVSGRVLSWWEWSGKLGYYVDRLAPSQVAEWLQVPAS